MCADRGRLDRLSHANSLPLSISLSLALSLSHSLALSHSHSLTLSHSHPEPYAPTQVAHRHARHLVTSVGKASTFLSSVLSTSTSNLQ